MSTIAAGGTTTVAYTLIGNSSPNSPGPGDPNGCDADASHPVIVTINRPAGVTGSPSSLVFDGCGNDNTKTATFSSNTGGTYPITHSVGGGVADSLFNNQADFTLKVNGSVSSNSAPSLNLPSNLTAEATNAGGATVSYAVTASDAEDNRDPAPSCSPASGSAFPLGPRTVQCSVTDSGGMTTSGHFNVTVVDTTAPLLTLPPDITAEAIGPLGAVVNYSASATDLVDGPVTPVCLPLSWSTFALGTTQVDCSAADFHGNTATGGFNVTVEDTAPPVITFVTRTAANGNGWNNTDVTVEWSCADTGSGVVSASVTETVSAEGAHQSATGTCTDLAGNTASDTQTAIDIDKQAPTVAYTSASPAPNAAGWNNTDVIATFTATDNLSRFAGPSTAKTGTSTASDEGAAVTVGSPVFTDLAGNTAPAGAATSDPFRIDKTAPLVHCNPADGNWHAADVSIACTASDALSQLANPADASFSLATTVAAGTETSDASTGSRTVYDAAGNAATAGPVTGNKVDRKAPAIACLASAPQFTIGQSPANVSATATDSGSGPGSQNLSTSATRRRTRARTA